MDGTVLVADDDRTIRTVLTQALTRAGCRVHATSSLTTLVRWVQEGKGDLVVTDVMMPDGNGIEMIPAIRAARPGLPVIVISAQNTIMTAIKANEAQAFDYLPKPFDLPDLMKRASRALLSPRSTAETSHDPAPSPEDELPMVGRTAVMQDLYALVARVMNTDLPVLITGESGTGKSLVARAIHDLGDRRNLPFVVAAPTVFDTVDGPASLIARARGGTVVFDEVGDLPPEAQARLAWMLDAFDGDGSQPRVIATSQASLERSAEGGTFRQDLFYRLGAVTVPVPPLRDRMDDIPLLAEHFLSRAERDGLGRRDLTGPAMERIRGFTWPGNVRQLENTMRRLAVTGGTPEIGPGEVDQVLGSRVQREDTAAIARSDDGRLADSIGRHLRRHFDLHAGDLPPPGLYQRVLREMETPLIEIALDATGGNQARCADLLGINRNTLRKKITDLGLEVTRRRKLA